jgi:hypothetical protein
MDITCIAVVWNNKDEQFVIEVKSFQYQKEKYEKWSSDTTLKDKTSIHEWDPDNDKLAINKFRQVGGVANFVEYKEHRIADGHSAELSSLFEHRPNHIVIGCSDVLCKDDVYRGHHCALVGVNTEVSTVSVHEKEHLTNLVSWMQKESREEQSLVKKQMRQQKTAAKKSGNKNAPNPAPLPPELVERSTDAIHESWGENDYFLLAFVGAFGPTCQSDEALKNKFFDLLKAAGLPLDDIDGSGTVVQRPTDLSSIMATASRLLDSTALSDAASKVFTVKDDCFFSVKEEIPALTESGEQLYLALEQFTQEERNLTSEAFFNRFKSLIGSKRDDVCTQLQGFIGPQKVKPQQNKKRKDMGNNQQARRRSTRISSTNPNPAKTASDDKELIDDGDENEDLFAKTASDDKEEEHESIDDDDETENLFDSDEELEESNKYQKVDR